MPREFLNKSISGILFISASCTAILLLLWLHPLCHLPPSVPFTGHHQIFIAFLLLNKSSTPISQPTHPHPPLLLQSGYFHSQVKRDRLGIHFSDDFPSSSIRTFPLLSFNSNASHCDSYSSLLSHRSLHFMLSSRTLLLLPLHSACWNTRWRRGSGAAVAASVPPGVGVWGVEVGAILTSSQQQWWWSSARCSLARRVPYGPPSLPPSSRGPTKEEEEEETWLFDIFVIWSPAMGDCNNHINVLCVNNEIICVPSEIHLAQIKSVLKVKPSRFERLLASASRPQNWVFMHWCVWRFWANVLPWRLSYQWKTCPKYTLSRLFYFLYLHK